MFLWNTLQFKTGTRFFGKFFYELVPHPFKIKKFNL